MSFGLNGDVARWWAQHAAGELQEDGFAQIDIDALADDPPQLAAAAALEAVQEALRLAHQAHPWAIGLVTIPLEPSESLVSESPLLDELLSMTWSYEPGFEVPGIYLLKPELLGEQTDEDVRLDLTGTGPLPNGFFAYYRCWRTAADAERGWEYGRTVYVRSG